MPVLTAMLPSRRLTPPVLPLPPTVIAFVVVEPLVVTSARVCVSVYDVRYPANAWSPQLCAEFHCVELPPVTLT